MSRGLCLLAWVAVCSSNATPPVAPTVGAAGRPSDNLPRFAPSLRAERAAPAVIEEVCERYLKPGVTNLAAGFSYWGPPDACIAEAQKLVSENPMELHRYGACLGLPELCSMLKTKLAKENGIRGREVMVTAGANMAFVHAAIALCNPGDGAILFTPYYFSHRVALELHGIVPVLVDCDIDMVPCANNLQAALARAREKGIKIRMVTIVTPGNPSGTVIEQQRLHDLTKVCAENRVWLVCDETYEYFTFDGAVHTSPTAADGVINIYSLSKSYGLAGWRVGYLAYPPSLHAVMLKAQDTLVTNCPIISQRVAIAALGVGSAWVRDKVRTLEASRKAIYEAIEPLNPALANGAFYFMIKVPSMLDELETVGLLAEKHRVLLTPGSAFGMPGYCRIAFGAIHPDDAHQVGLRMMKGMTEMVRAGLRLSFDLQRSIPLASGRQGFWGRLDDEDKLIAQVGPSASASRFVWTPPTDFTCLGLCRPSFLDVHGSLSLKYMRRKHTRSISKRQQTARCSRSRTTPKLGHVVSQWLLGSPILREQSPDGQIARRVRHDLHRNKLSSHSHVLTQIVMNTPIL